MQKTKKTMSTLLKVYIVFIIAVIYTFNYSSVFAKDKLKVTIKPVEYTDEYKRYLSLSEEEKEKILVPNQYYTTKTPVASANPVYISNLLGSLLGAGNPSSYDLRNIISQNLVVRDQGQLNNCWAFASIGSAESSLALADYKAGNTSNTYNFSEKHLDYIASRNSTSNTPNIYGVNKDIAEGGVGEWAYASMAGGHSLANESSMPYDSSTTQTTTSVLYNKPVVTELYDTRILSSRDATANINDVKNFIQNYGGVFASLHGADMFSNNCDYYNSSTGAIYCSASANYEPDHAVLIVGWDDNYSKNNFLASQRPSNNGAWIIKNSWGTGIGINGFMYVSYEDANINKDNMGIQKIKNGLDYDYIYQYDELFPVQQSNISFERTVPVYLKNNFTKQSSGDEYLTKVGITVPETQTLQVYVNPSGTGTSSGSMQLVQLEEGSSKTVEAGFHKLIFKDPIKITGSSFSVCIAMTGSSQYTYYTESVTPSDYNKYYTTAKIERNKCFLGYGNSPSGVQTWEDLGNYSATYSNILDGDTTIKAFTKTSTDAPEVTGISIKTNPTKTTYYAGDNFNPAGMVIQANYSDGTSVVLDSSDLTISNASNLSAGQTSVKVTWDNFSINVPITVLENSVTSLSITHSPNKTSYEAGENFDPTGLVITATYANGSTNTINNSAITFTNNTSLEVGQTYVKASFGGKSVNIPITVSENSITSLTIDHSPTKTTYYEGDSFDPTGMIIKANYSNGSSETLNNSSLTITNGDNLTNNQTSVKVSYNGVSINVPITVLENSVTSLEITHAPTKTTYEEGENFDPSGLVIKATYANGNSRTINNSSITFTNNNSLTEGQTSVKASYGGKSINISITVNKTQNPPSSGDDNSTPEEPGDPGEPDTPDDPQNPGEPDTPDNPDEPETPQEPTNTDFTYAESNINGLEYRVYSDDDKEERFKVDFIIKNLNRPTSNDSMEYYVYLSSKLNEQNISGWVKITEAQTNNSQLKFSVNLTDFPNVLDEADSLYVYVKEVAKRGGNQTSVTTLGLKTEIDNNTQVDYYEDDVLKYSKTMGDLYQETEVKYKDVKDEDTTTSNGRLPQTGTKMAASIVIGFIVLYGVHSFINYKNINSKLK